MTIVLGTMAGLIFLLYSYYFYKIIKEVPQAFELELVRSLANWIIVTGPPSRAYLWLMFYVSVLLEALYFYLTLTVISNPVIYMLTAMFIPLEVFHLTRLGLGLRRFFKGVSLLSQVFSWSMERISAVLFFTHALLVLASLLIFV